MKTKHWIMVGAAAVVGAAVALWLIDHDRSDAEKPRKGVPQTPLNNPGEQSEFYTAPGESEIG
jgi:hypothetical protein